jgi:hypothetical protein
VKVERGLREEAEKLKEAVGGVFPGEEGGAEGLGQKGGGVGTLGGGGRDAVGGKADGACDGDDEGRDGANREGAVAEAASRGWDDGEELGMLREGVGLAGQMLEEGEELRLEGVSKCGVPVEGRGRGIKGGMVVNVGGKKMVHSGLDTIVEEGCLCLGVKNADQELVGEGGKGSKFVLKEGVSKGEVTNGLTEDTEAGGAFGRGG